MLLVGGLARGARSRSTNGLLLGWIIGGCIASALALFALAIAGSVGPAWPLDITVFALGIAVGAFSVAAIGSMMGLVQAGRERREGTRMGLWGAAQGIAFGVGSLAGTAAIDWTRHVFESQALAYSVVFAAEGGLFLVSAWLAAWVERAGRQEQAAAGVSPGALVFNEG
jgi:BCD family chlorophyll transporter-like MFS transporter